MGAYVSVGERRARNAAASQAEIDRRQTLERGSTAVRQPGVTGRDFAQASIVDRIRRRGQGR